MGRRYAERFNDEASLISSAFALGQAYWNRGEFSQAERILSDTIGALPRGMPGTQSGTTGTASLMCLVSLSHTHSLAGDSRQALARGLEALEMAMETERPYDLSYAHAALGLAHLTFGELADAIRHLEEASRIARSHEIMLLLPHTARYLGRALALDGQLDKAEQILAEAVEQTRSQSLAALSGWCLAELGFVRASRVPIVDAEPLVNDALTFARRQKYRALEAHALRVMGIVVAKAGDDDALARAACCFTEAVALAREIAMRPEQALSHHARADLLAATGRLSEARTDLLTALELYRAMGMVRGERSASASLADVMRSGGQASMMQTAAGSQTV